VTVSVTVFLGSESDFDVIEGGLDILKDFGVPFSLEVTSAHRSPERTLRLVREAEARGTAVFIAVAGKAAHLAGVVAAHTVRPVIGVPVDSAALGGMDALLSTVQMPKGIPVATVALGKAGGANAALLAVEILAVGDAALREKLVAHRKKMAEKVEANSRKLQEKI
jgi:5-(carboxyamino)imidazole ribonucleotide mutase